jgi:hypothetical protein
MFAENSARSETRAAAYMRGLAASRPIAFDAILALLAIAVTILLLYQSGSSFVLYQGF